MSAKAQKSTHETFAEMHRSSLNNTERTNYITAVKCLAAKPPKYSASVAPGAKSRYDDFVVTHIQQTLSIHGTVRRNFALLLPPALTISGKLSGLA